MQVTEKIIKSVCKDLKIQMPNISFDISNFTSNTMLAQCNPDKNIIYIKKFDKLNPDIIFAIVHELRHLWQIHTDKSFYTAHYSTALSVEEYNKQIAEIDANAYAGAFMINIFGIKPLFKRLSKDVVDLIYKRMEEI